MSITGTIFSPDVGARQFSLVDFLLIDQQELTPVEQLARLAESTSAPPLAPYYRQLMPLTPPGEGEQYAFEVDLDCCSGCKACVTACHALNGLDDNETWRDVGLLHGGTVEFPVVQHVTTACHHCLDPACLRACPVDAYEKETLTGIVKHLDDQCFGCQYCILACPYDVPKYNKARGIVRKCDLCSQRIAVGEAPACVQACPHRAIRIHVVSRQDLVHDCESSAFLPGAPDPQLTLPTTNYRSARPLPRNTLPADYYAVRPEHSHLPLAFMLVLTQLSVGAFIIDLLLKHDGLVSRQVLADTLPLHCMSGLFFGILALAASTCHLGRPLYAFRAVIGLKHSWLSREIVAFALFALLASAYAAWCWLWPPGEAEHGRLRATLGALVVIAGLLAIFCSVMVYHSTRRAFWNAATVSIKFFLTTLLLGAATALLTGVVAAGGSDLLTAGRAMSEYGDTLCKWLIVITVVKLSFESQTFLHLRAKHNTLLKRTAMLMTGQLAGVTRQRFISGIIGGIALPGLLLAPESLSAGAQWRDSVIAIVVVMLFVAALTGEFLERYLFFTAAVAPRMPGGLT
jgi:Fe-S-cluster-containing dehydrogenase component/DMSO reductase anchor subunit